MQSVLKFIVKYSCFLSSEIFGEIFGVVQPLIHRTLTYNIMGMKPVLRWVAWPYGVEYYCGIIP